MLGHDTANCIVTQASRGVQQGPQHDPQPNYCMHGLAAGGESRYNSLYRGWGRPLVSQYGAARLRYSVATRQQHAMTRRCASIVGIESRYNFLYRDRRGRQHGLRHDQFALRHGRARPRYGALRATTRHPARCVHPAWVQHARGLGAVRVQPGFLGCAPCALDPVLTHALF